MEMEPIVPRFKRSKFRKPLNDVDAVVDGSKFREVPESVVHHIFSFLKTIDVIRASAVSTNWRYLWTSMPHLNFDYGAIRSCPSTGYDKYKDFINWVLVTHDKSVNIKSCRLTCSYNEDDSSVDRWLRILVEKHVQQLYLTLTSETDRESPFALPRCLFASDSLEVLELNVGYCFLKTPSNAGFSRLKSLKLMEAVLYEQNLFQNFISSCPLLENLSLKDSMFHNFNVLDISSRNLRKLVIDTYSFELSVLECLCECDLKIASPNLVYFELKGHLVHSLSWGKYPSFLQTAIIFTFFEDNSVLSDEFADSVMKIIRRVCHAKDLKLAMDILEYISPAVAKPGCFTVFHNLKAIKLSTGMNVCYIQSIIYLLKCAPTLQLLSVLIKDNMRYERDYKWKMLDEDIACLKCHLKMVKLIKIDTMDDELELIRFFLKNGHVLEKMSIIWKYNVRWKTQRATIKKVLKFPRSSSHVNVTFS